MAITIKATNEAKDGTVWATIDTDGLSDDVRQAYATYRDAQRMANELKAEFEAKFRQEAGTDGIRFGYNFGRLAIAQGEAPKAKATAKPTVSLASFLAGQASSGRRA